MPLCRCWVIDGTTLDSWYNDMKKKNMTSNNIISNQLSQKHDRTKWTNGLMDLNLLWNSTPLSDTESQAIEYGLISQKKNQ